MRFLKNYWTNSHGNVSLCSGSHSGVPNSAFRSSGPNNVLQRTASAGPGGFNIDVGLGEIFFQTSFFLFNLNNMTRIFKWKHKV